MLTFGPVRGSDTSCALQSGKELPGRVTVEGNSPLKSCIFDMPPKRGLSKRSTDGAKRFDVTQDDAVERMKGFVDSYADGEKTFDTELMLNTKVISGSACSPERDAMEAKASLEVFVDKTLANPMGNMHGGAVALLVDMATSIAMAIISEPGWWVFSGVSRTLNVTFIRPVPIGATLIVDCEVRSVSKRLAMIQCYIKDKATGKLLATGEHGKSALSEQVRSSKL